MTFLRLDDVTKRFGGLSVLTGVTVDIAQGERHALIGPNGAGKSTLFNLISGRLTPTSGRIVLRGADIAGRAPHRIARLGVGRSFQIINVFPKLSVFENIRGAVLSRQKRWYDCFSDVDRLPGVADESEAFIDQVGLKSRRDTPAHALSYGEQRKLEIALTVAMGCELMLLDEPCAGLNAEDTHAAIELIRRVSEGRTLVMVEHDMNVVFGLADRVSVLYYGKVLATGTPAEIRANEQVQQAYLGRKSSVAPS